MKYVDGFRDADAAGYIKKKIGEIGGRLAERGRIVRIMEVCGSHTMAIARYGIRQALPASVELLSGPGCPVCVTDAGYIDAGIGLTCLGAVVATFGDLMRVPGSAGTLAQARGNGADIRVCYSPLGALELAQKHPDREIVFLAVGFETTVAPAVGLLRAARDKGIANLSILTAFKLVPPALRALIDDPAVAIDAFLCPAHVSAIIGAQAYRPFADVDRMPCVIAGFEPLDILYGLLEILEQIERGEARVVNQYSRVVREEGNRTALKLMNEWLEPADVSWRGLGMIPKSGLALRPAFRSWDAEARHGIRAIPALPDPRCRCGDVLKGVISPPDCPLFARGCTPDHPVGPCMVSSEGSCAARFQYERRI